VKSSEAAKILRHWFIWHLSSRPWTVRIAENVTLLVTSCSLGKVPGAPRHISEFAKNTGDRRLSAGRIIFRATHPEENNNVPIWLLM